jgi:hypothetical protein
MNMNRYGRRHLPRALLIIGIVGTLPTGTQADQRVQARTHAYEKPVSQAELHEHANANGHGHEDRHEGGHEGGHARPGARPQPQIAGRPLTEIEAVAPGWPESETVDELLRRETRAALAMQRRRPGLHGPMAASGPESQPEQPADRIDLSAIYGVGKRLHVEVLLNGRRLRYRHGRKWPDQAPDGVGVYALRAIEGFCVRLAGAAGDRPICLALAP